MTEAAKRPDMPTGVLVLAGGFMLFIIAIAGVARITDNNHVILAPTQAVASRDLLFKDRNDGGVEVTDAATGQQVALVAPATGGFLRGIMRGLVRDHRRAEGPVGSAFRLTRWADGRLSIADPMNHETFELEAFGSTNAAVFARFLPETVGARSGTEGR